MDEDYPNPEDEFEMMYADELDMLDEMGDDPYDTEPVKPTNSAPVRRSLNFAGSKATSESAAAKPKETEKSKPDNDSTTFMSTPVETRPHRPSFAPLSQSGAGASGNKRSFADVFGDIDDIELEEAMEAFSSGPKTKQPRKSLMEESSFFFYEEPVEEDDSGRDKEAELIEKIVLLRKKAFLESESERSAASPSTFQCRGNSNSMTKGVPKWPFVPVTSELGQRVYVRVRSEEQFDEECGKVSRQGKATGLLKIPYSTLKSSAMKLLEKKQEDAIAAQEAEIVALTSKDDDRSISTTDDGSLWVVKYKPKRYADLLSEESINRTLLHWLKLWDKVVFNRERKVKIKPKEEKKEGNNRFQKFQKKPFGQVMTDDLDEHGRPQYKMVMLCGPPGLGKTTLAHMCATLAGYNVVELNASDDRSPEAFRAQLEAATQMRAVMGKDPRPNCLVLDEIDGAPAASIETLIKFVLGKDVGKGRGKKKGSTPGILKRPLICICNDLYVPALRPLRQNAFILHFPPTASDRLASRLVAIAREQSIKTDMGAMLALCTKTQNDVRSCLSLLHYFKTQGRNVHLSDIQKSNIGQKDMQKGLFAVWHDIFQIKRSRGAFTQAAIAAAAKDADSQMGSPENKGENTLEASMQHVLRTVQSHGDYDRLAQGVFENYPNMRLKDSSLNGLVKGLEWFCTNDLLTTEIHTSQNYILMPYMAYAFAVWHVVYAGLVWPKITYPNTGYEVSVKETNTKQIVGEVVKGMSPAVRAHCNPSKLVLDVLPMLFDIIVPNLRPVSLQLYSTREKQELYTLISIMIDYNLTYTQERTPEGTYVCVLDPNIEQVVLLGDMKVSRALTYGAKQLVAREIELEKMRRYELVAVGKENKSENPVEVTALLPQANETESKGKDEKEKTAKKASPPVPNHLRKLKAKPIISEMQTKDFFGRIVNITLSPSTVKAKSEKLAKGDIWFHFKEGFNNAVRKTVRIADLM